MLSERPAQIAPTCLKEALLTFPLSNTDRLSRKAICTSTSSLCKCLTVTGGCLRNAAALQPRTGNGTLHNKYTVIQIDSIAVVHHHYSFVSGKEKASLRCAWLFLSASCLLLLTSKTPHELLSAVTHQAVNLGIRRAAFTAALRPSATLSLCKAGPRAKY